MSKPTVPQVLPLALAYYAKPGNGVGGALHIVLDDGNLDNESINYCITFAIARGDVDAFNLGKLLLQMSATQRKKIYLSLHR